MALHPPFLSASQAARLPAPVRPRRCLVVTPRLEVRKPLLHVLEGLFSDVISCSSCEQAREVLASQPFDAVFCDEHLADGCYADLIHPNNFDSRTPRVIVATRLGEWEFYLEAVRKGAFDVVRSPWYATDVEMVVIRALREAELNESSDS